MPKNKAMVNILPSSTDSSKYTKRLKLTNVDSNSSVPIVKTPKSPLKQGATLQLHLWKTPERKAHHTTVSGTPLTYPSPSFATKGKLWNRKPPQVSLLGKPLKRPGSFTELSFANRQQSPNLENGSPRKDKGHQNPPSNPPNPCPKSTETAQCLPCGVILKLNNKSFHKHPKLNIVICSKCYKFYFSGEWKRDGDGHYMHCQCCADGGKIVCCSRCPETACRSCLKRLLGRRQLESALHEDWLCLVCNPQPLAAYKSLADRVFGRSDADDVVGPRTVENTILHLETSLTTWRKSILKMKRRNAATITKEREACRTRSLKANLASLLQNMKEVVSDVEKNIFDGGSPPEKVIKLISNSFKKADGPHLTSPDLRGYWLLGDSQATEDDSSDSGAEVELPTIRVGAEFQAVIPDLVERSNARIEPEREDLLVWSPSHLAELRVTTFLLEAASLNSPPYGAVKSTEGVGFVKDNEWALFLLLKSGYDPALALSDLLRSQSGNRDVRNAISSSCLLSSPVRVRVPCGGGSLTSLTEKRSSGNGIETPVGSSADASVSVARSNTSFGHRLPWTELEAQNFESGVRYFGKNFGAIKRRLLPGRGVAEIVQFYYLWKRTERRDLVFGIGTRIPTVYEADAD